MRQRPGPWTLLTTTQRLLSGDVQRNPACLDRVTRRSFRYISRLRVFTRQTGCPYIPAVHSPSSLSQPSYQGPSPHGEGKCRSILGQSESPCHPPYSLFWSGTCLSPPSPASFFDGPYISLLGVPQLNIHTRRFKPRTSIFSQFRRLKVQGWGTSRFSFFCGLSPWPAQGHFSLCLPRSFFCVHISLVFVYVSTCLLLIETPVTLGSPTLTASF